MATPPQDTLSVHVKSELQYDVDAQQSAFGGDAMSGFAITSTSDSELSVYYINGGGVFTAYQDSSLLSTGSPPWSVEDMKFPASNPGSVHAVRMPDSAHDFIVVVTADRNAAYMVEVGVRFPVWKQFPLPSSPLVMNGLQVVIGSDNFLRFTAFTDDGSMYISDPDSVFTDGWAQDVGVLAFQRQVTSFTVETSLSSTLNQTPFGYAIASSGPQGLAFITGGSFSIATPAIITTIDKGAYTAVWTAPLPGDAGSSLPVVFAVDNLYNAYYFRPQDDGTFAKVQIFTGIKVMQLEPVIRVRGGTVSGCDSLWMEIFVLDNNGRVYHLESGRKDDGTDLFTPIANGNYVVQAWRGDFAVLSPDTVKSISSVQTGTGDAFLMTYSQSNNANSLTLFTQDPETTDWTTKAIALPAAGTASSSGTIQTLKAYYVEATILDGNRVQLPNRAAVISSTQLATIIINGRAYEVDPKRSATAITNASGRVAFILYAPEGLAVPTFTIWVEGMDLDAVIDVKPTGEIQSTLASLTVASMRAAVNKDDPSLPPVFPSTTTDDDLSEAAKGIAEVIKVMDPGFKQLNVPLEEVDHTSFSRRHIYRRTRPTLARTRKRTDPSLGRIRGKASHGVSITLIPVLKVGILDATQAHKLRSDWKANFLGIDLSWGDIWNSIKGGLMTVKGIIIDPLVDGVKATIHLLKDGVEYVWDGIVNFVEKVYDVITSILQTVGATLDAIFGWLAFLLDWDDIKRTAQKFQTTILGCQQFGQDLFGPVLQGITKGGFAKAKAWIEQNITAVETALAGETVGTYDKDKPPLPSLLNAVDQSGGLLDDLPATATWLMNKVFNASTGNAAVFTFTQSTLGIDSIWNTFYNSAQATGMGSDFQTAYQKLGDMLTTFKDRGLFDAASWVSLLEVAKAFLFIVLDVAEAAALAFESVVAAAFGFLGDIFNVNLDIPVISSVFKSLTGVELTLMNTITFILAIPFNIIYKVITGQKPFPDAVTLKEDLTLSTSPADGATIGKGIVMVLSGLWVTTQDAIANEMNVTTRGSDKGPSDGLIRAGAVIKRLLVGFNVSLAILVIGPAGYPAIATLKPIALTGWAITLLPAALHLGYLVKYRGTKGPARDIVGQSCFAIIGVAQLGMAIWSTVDTSQSGWTPKSKAAVVSQWFLPWSNLTRWLNSVIMGMDPASAQYVIVAQGVINLASGLGAGIALITSGALPDSKEEEHEMALKDSIGDIDHKDREKEEAAVKY